MKNRHEPSRTTQVGGTIAKSIGPYYTEYINELIKSGKYLTVAEVLRSALRNYEGNQNSKKYV